MCWSWVKIITCILQMGSTLSHYWYGTEETVTEKTPLAPNHNANENNVTQTGVNVVVTDTHM